MPLGPIWSPPLTSNSELLVSQSPHVLRNTARSPPQLPRYRSGLHHYLSPTDRSQGCQAAGCYCSPMKACLCRRTVLPYHFCPVTVVIGLPPTSTEKNV